MDYSNAFLISATGMAIERMRVDVAALNLANANTVQEPDGSTYQPARVLVRSAAGPLPSPAFDNLLASLSANSQAATPELLPGASIVRSTGTSRRVHEPAHPLAGKDGFVSYARVDTASEMVSLMSATRAYEANVAAFNASRTMALRALEIGRGN